MTPSLVLGGGFATVCYLVFILVAFGAGAFIMSIFAVLSFLVVCIGLEVPSSRTTNRLN